MRSVTPFDRELFVESCIAAASDSDPLSAIRDVLLRAISEPAALDAAFPVPIAETDTDGVLYLGDDLLVVYAIFPQHFSTGIHNHTVPAVIGVWSGYEDNHLFEAVDGGLRPLGAPRLEVGEVLLLGADAIHDVHTPPTTYSAALHVYLGDIIHAERSCWDDTSSGPSPFDGAEQERHWMEAATATGLLLPASQSTTAS